MCKRESGKKLLQAHWTPVSLSNVFIVFSLFLFFPEATKLAYSMYYVCVPVRIIFFWSVICSKGEIIHVLRVAHLRSIMEGRKREEREKRMRHSLP